MTTDIPNDRPKFNVTIDEGQTLTLHHKTTDDTFNFKVLAMENYKGNYILYGGVSAHGIRVYSGVKVIQPRDGMIVWLYRETNSNVLAMTSLLKGEPFELLFESKLVVQSGRTVTPARTGGVNVLNSSKQSVVRPNITFEPTPGTGGNQGRPVAGQRDKFMQRGRHMIDLYIKWVESGRLFVPREEPVNGNNPG